MLNKDFNYIFIIIFFIYTIARDKEIKEKNEEIKKLREVEANNK